ncbi:Uncharacterized protein apha_01651 [Umezakia ovalisporum]|jgi:hypothetical protein|uniref:hypothetical protein n=1 Tax=Umezakia ovalisporum TaxID=75695 RepID=UPI0006EE6D78|nr:hypothetical protein [Umezakia ovalisporum]MDH6076091.1 hypothetical protein [Umezakia ovalisporum CS-1034]CEJ44926.1 Uncharacterized protein apha_01651 [Umezakia ovalisporum]
MESTDINLFKSREKTLIGDFQPQKPPFAGIDEVLAENLLLSDTNDISNEKPVGNSVINPFAGGVSSQLNELVFGRLQSVLGENEVVSGSGNSFTDGDNSSFNQDNPPFGYGSRNFGSDNANIGNFNSDFGSDSATIGNGNWNFNNDNATIGNGNWLFGSNNTNLGNGNWYWDESSNNSTLGNGNWQFNSDNSTIGNGNWGFGENNTTIGNGNWDFGNHNTIIGNGNWIFDDNNTIIGNGNWIFDDNNTIIGNDKSTSKSESLPLDIKTDVDNLIDSLIGIMGEKFLPLTGGLGVSETETFNRLILSQNNGNISTDIEQFLALLGKIKSNRIASGTALGPMPYQHGQNLQPVPEPSFSVSLLVMGVVCLLWSKLKQGFFD